MLYKTSDPKVIHREIKKLQPLNYNQFMWWRRFASKNKPLPKGATFFQRIQNKEFEFSHLYDYTCPKIDLILGTLYIAVPKFEEFLKQEIEF